MNKKMKEYVADFDRNCDNLQNEWYIRNLPLTEKIDAMENHEKMHETFEEIEEDVKSHLNYLHKLNWHDTDGMNVWTYFYDKNNKLHPIDGNEILTDYIISTFFPANCIMNENWNSWICDYEDLVKDFRNKLIELYKKYNNKNDYDKEEN